MFLGMQEMMFLGEKKNLFAWKARNLILSFLTTFSITCITWTFDIFENFKMNVQAFQCVYKGFKLVIETLRDYLIMKKNEIAWRTSKNDFLRQFYVCSIMENCMERVSTNLTCFGIILASLTCGRKRKIRFGKSKHLPTCV